VADPPEASPIGVSEVPDHLYEGYILDLDGTVYLGDVLLPGAERLIRKLRELDRRVVFLSNNPTGDPQMYADKLTGLGLQTSASEIVNTVVTMVRWLLRNHPGATVFPIGEEPLKCSLREAGIKISENPEQIDFVIASYDRTFDYRKLQIAFDAIWYHERARLITTNLDRYCPLPDGRGEPVAAAVIGAIEACTGAKCEANVGKPDPIMLTTALDLLGLSEKDCVMTGDRLYTDIRMALGVGMPCAVVLTGETTAELLMKEPRENRPTYFLNRVDHLIPPRMWKEYGWTENGG
jgi:HAD superfamily hydrolase (TIGR01450 family)